MVYWNELLSLTVESTFSKYWVSNMQFHCRSIRCLPRYFARFLKTKVHPTEGTDFNFQHNQKHGGCKFHQCTSSINIEFTGQWSHKHKNIKQTYVLKASASGLNKKLRPYNKRMWFENIQLSIRYRLLNSWKGQINTDDLFLRKDGKEETNIKL